jgi:hypothetical protein
MITAILILFAAICKAMADTLDHHFDTSIFRNKPRKWFDPNVIIKTAPKIFNYPIDAWHISNSLMIASFILAAIFYEQKAAWYIEFSLYGLGFTMVFNIFYNRVFR